MLSTWPEQSKPTEPLQGHVDVWAVDINSLVERLDEMTASLSDVECIRSAEFRVAAARQRYIITRAEMRSLVGRYLGIAPTAVILSLDLNGKPRLENTAPRDLRINVAHSANIGLLAVTLGCEVGVDVEHVRPVNHATQLARRYFQSAELEAIAAAEPLNRDRAFLRCWTAKEAILKSVGSGITGKLDTFGVPVKEFDATWIGLPAQVGFERPIRCWLQELSPCQDYVGAVACVGEPRNLRCQSLAL